jgi:hypothetical protein
MLARGNWNEIPIEKVKQVEKIIYYNDDGINESSFIWKPVNYNIAVTRFSDK